MSQIVKVFMLICVICLCGLGYLYIAGNLGISEKIVGNTTDNATLVKENSTYYDEGKGLLVGSDFIGMTILIFVILLFIVLFVLALKNAGWM
jgi:hypothetical protein